MSRGRSRKSAEKPRSGLVPHTVSIGSAENPEEHESAQDFLATSSRVRDESVENASPLPPALQGMMDAFQQQRDSQHLAFLIQQESLWAPHRQREAQYARLLHDAFSKASTMEVSLEAIWERRLSDLRQRSDKEEQVLDKRLAMFVVAWMESARQTAERCREVGNMKINQVVERLSRQLQELESTVDTVFSVGAVADVKPQATSEEGLPSRLFKLEIDRIAKAHNMVNHSDTSASNTGLSAYAGSDAAEGGRSGAGDDGDESWETESDEEEPQPAPKKMRKPTVASAVHHSDSPLFAPVELSVDHSPTAPLQPTVGLDPLASDLLHLFAEVFEADQSTRDSSFGASQAQINATLEGTTGVNWQGAVVKCRSRLEANFSAFLQRLEASAAAALDNAYMVPELSDVIKPALATLSTEMQMVSRELVKSLEGSLWPLLNCFRRMENRLTPATSGDPIRLPTPSPSPSNLSSDRLTSDNAPEETDFDNGGGDNEGTEITGHSGRPSPGQIKMRRHPDPIDLVFSPRSLLRWPKLHTKLPILPPLATSHGLQTVRESPLPPTTIEATPTSDPEPVFQIAQQERQAAFTASQLNRQQQMQVAEPRRAHTFELAMLGWTVELEQAAEALSARFNSRIVKVQSAQDDARRDFREECDDMLQRATRSFAQAMKNRHSEWAGGLETALTAVEMGASNAMVQMRAMFPEPVVAPVVVPAVEVPVQAAEIESGWFAHFKAIISSVL